LGFFIFGSLLPLAFVIPTFIQYGLGVINSHSGFYVPFNWTNVKLIVVLLARLLSLVCFEVPVFIGVHFVTRIAFLTDHPLILVQGAFLWIAGLIQPFVLLFYWFKKDHFVPRWTETKWLMLVVFLIVYGSFWFTIKAPLSHIYYVLFPLLMIYSCYCWAFFISNSRFRILAKVFLVFGFLFQVGYAVIMAPQDSIYPQRGVVLKAIQEKNYHLLGERTQGDLY